MSKESKQYEKVAVLLKNALLKAFKDASNASINSGFTFNLTEGIENRPHPDYPKDPKKVIKVLTIGITISELGYKNDRILQEFPFQYPTNVNIHEVKYNAYSNVLTYLTHTSLIVLYQTMKELNTDKDLQKSAIILKHG